MVENGVFMGTCLTASILTSISEDILSGPTL